MYSQRVTPVAPPGHPVPDDEDPDRPLSVLLVEDNPGDARLVREYLDAAPDLEARIRHVRSLREATEELAEGPTDVILLDLGLPDSRGPKSVRDLSASHPGFPVVVLTGLSHRDAAVRCLQEGAQDYLVKGDLEPALLSRSLRYALERSRTERALQAARFKLDLLDQNLEEVFYLWDFSTEPRQLAFCSSAYETLWGRPVEEVQREPLTFVEGIHPDDRQRVKDNLEEKLRGDRQELYRIIRPDGEVRWIRDQSYPISDEEGSVRWVAGTAIDVTDQVRLQEELREERGRLKEVFRDAPVFIATLEGPDHTFEMANPAYRELVGDRELIGKPVREVFPDLEGQGIFELLDRVYESGEPYRAQERLVEMERGGALDRRYLSFVYQPRRRGDEITGIIAIGVDVTNQVRARKEAHDRRETLERILETTADGVMFAGPDGEFRYANPAAEEILGLEESEIAARTYEDPRWEITGPDGGPFLDEKLPVARVLRTGEPVIGVEHGVLRPDGTRIVLSVNAAPIRLSSGETGVVASIRDVTDRKEFETQLRHRALHDPLTGLPNRALFQDRLEHARERARRTADALAVLFLDLDRFKVVNDSLGHEAGDRLLEEVARRLQSAVREQDTVARMGGDEFTVILEEVGDESGTRDAADRVLAALREPVRLGDQEIVIDVSVGGAVLREDDESWTDLVSRADAAMYRAKARPGTGVVVSASAPMDGEPAEAGASPLEKEARLRAAVEADSLGTAYQPIFSLEDGSLRGVEALARWTDPVLGTVSPREFITLAENTGLIVPLGMNQLRRACRDASRWLAAVAGAEFTLHVNLSPRQLEDPDVVGRVLRVLEETGYPGEHLALEVTESAALREPETTRRLQELGIRLSVDDFGTEYSTLTQLRRLEVDQLKIDRSFVMALPDDHRDAAIVQAVVSLGQALDLDVVAEGIESEDQAALLRELGCRLGQGYHLGMPGPPEAISALL